VPLSHGEAIAAAPSHDENYPAVSLPWIWASPRLTSMGSVQRCRTCHRPAAATGVPPPSKNATVTALLCRLTMAGPLRWAPRYPPCVVITTQFPVRGRQDLVARDAAGELHEPRHCAAAARGHRPTRTEPGAAPWAMWAILASGSSRPCWASGRKRLSTVRPSFLIFWFSVIFPEKTHKVLKCVANTIWPRKI
jgi:hypothetical protein